jgi:epoxyqueuosine reductase QueG
VALVQLVSTLVQTGNRCTYVVDGSKCISYFTIELKENIPQEMKGKFDDWAFGCDVCQDVCPGIS